MRKVYRFENNENYWDRRWGEAGSDAERFERMDIYPIKYAEMVMEPELRAVELGCGLGRIVKHYSSLGYNICGIERSAIAIERIKSEIADIDVRVGDVLDLPFDKASFDVALAFGVYHNLESGLETALQETRRVLKDGGQFCISMRPDNIEMRFNEVYWRRKNRGRSTGKPLFHKLLVGVQEFKSNLLKAGLQTECVCYARNVSILYRVPFLRSGEERKVGEDVKRSRGYRLNAAGRVLDTILVALFPYQTANVLVFVGKAV